MCFYSKDFHSLLSKAVNYFSQCIGKISTASVNSVEKLIKIWVKVKVKVFIVRLSIQYSADFTSTFPF